MEVGFLDIVLSVSLLGFLGFASLITALYLRYKKKVYDKAQHDVARVHDAPDVIIIGAGIVGSALATVLARDGRKVTVIERSMVRPDSIKGENMLPGGVLAMKELGLDVTCSDVDGALLSGVTLYPPGGEPFSMPYEEKALAARGHRHVEALRELAHGEKRCTFIEGTVTALCMHNGIVTGVNYREKGQEEIKNISAALTVVADGQSSTFRATTVPRKAVLCNYNVGIESPLDDNHESALLPTSLGVWFTCPLTPTVRRFILNAYKANTREELLAIIDEIPESLRESYRKAAEESQVRSMPCYYLPPSMRHVPGVITLGDAFSIRNSFGASGMTVGLKDVCTWWKLLRGIPDLYNYDVMFAAENLFAVRRKQYSFVIDLIGYIIRHFYLPSSGGLELLGGSLGAYTPSIKEDWVLMYNGIDTRPQLLMYHIGQVTVRAMWSGLMSGGWTGLPYGVYKAGQAFVSACATIGPHVMAQITSMAIFRA